MTQVKHQGLSRLPFVEVGSFIKRVGLELFVFTYVNGTTVVPSRVTDRSELLLISVLQGQRVVK
jgi:hypothetical protein